MFNNLISNKKLWFIFLSVALFLSNSHSVNAELYDSKLSIKIKVILNAFLTSISTDRNFKYILTSSYDSILRLWNVEDGKLIKTIKLPLSENVKLYKAKISPDVRLIAAITSDGIFILDQNTGAIKERIDLSGGFKIDNYYYWFDINFSDSALFFTIYSYFDNKTRLYILNDKGQYELKRNFNGQLILLPSGNFLSMNENNLTIYDCNLRIKKKMKIRFNSSILSISPTGEKISNVNVSTVNKDRISSKIEIYTTDLRKIKQIHINTNIRRIFWSLDEKFLYVAGSKAQSSEIKIDDIFKISTSNWKILEIFRLSELGIIKDLIYVGDNKFSAITDDSLIFFSLIETY